MLRSLPRTVWLLGFISLLNDSASELIYPLLPLYLTSVMMAGPRLIGVLEGVAESLTSVLKLISGALSDRFARRKPPMLLGYGLAALARPLYTLATSFAMVFCLRLLDRVGKALRSAPRDALLAASVRPEQRGAAFGLHRSMDHLGAVIGPALAVLLLSFEVSIEKILLWAALPGFACMLLLVFWVQDNTIVSERQTAKAVKFEWHWGSLPTPLRRYYLCLALFALGNSSNMFLLLRAQDVGLTHIQIAFCWALMSLVATVLTTPFGILSDRIGRRPLIAIGWSCYGVLYFVFAFSSAGQIYWLFALMGLFVAATDGVEKALLADYLPEKSAAGGRMFGWFHLAAGLPLLPASIIFGELSHRGHATLAFFFAALCAWSAAALIYFWVGHCQTQDSKTY